MSESLAQRLTALDWDSLQRMLDEQGFASLPVLLDAVQCRELMDTYGQEERFRSTISMARYRFGLGEYKYYESPLPDVLQQLREGLYPELAKTANRWFERLGQDAVYPDTLAEFLDDCHRQGQERSTPLILKYEAGGYNCLHQDLYGDVYFPFQVVFALNQQEVDYAGGQFLLVEQRPRAQSRGHSIAIEQGAGLIFPTNYRPVEGSRGYYRTTLRHGVSTVTSGTRYSLGVIFHDAK
ncbi:2OG-Fe(II) oxygenase [Paenibacillus ginsengarvi]|uniref:Prolyl 4-hydroxylase subunit alpha n=1 Tax=Paenibacillus ginsengarvi TaxID=400777 RepID=A0A3B0BXN8_9BACL|nr:2OG-Fe(II) oxygenase [Paenibacillus ginsengarvi]RKN77094.1 prolyl 4-hydroxylase subunit alpha [Paenibacillus ginsengarvi]